MAGEAWGDSGLITCTDAGAGGPGRPSQPATLGHVGGDAPTRTGAVGSVSLCRVAPTSCRAGPSGQVRSASVLVICSSPCHVARTAYVAAEGMNRGPGLSRLKP